MRDEMAEVLQFELVSPERRLAAGEVDSVTIPGIEGDLTAMVNHAAFLTSLRPGFVTVRRSGSEESYYVGGGFAEIAANTVAVLADEAMEREALTRDYLEARIREAEEALEEAPASRLQPLRQRLDDLRALLSRI